jgi:hypothetical protein
MGRSAAEARPSVRGGVTAVEAALRSAIVAVEAAMVRKALSAAVRTIECAAAIGKGGVATETFDAASIHR